MLRHLLHCSLALGIAVAVCALAFLSMGWRPNVAMDQLALTATFQESALLWLCAIMLVASVLGGLFFGSSDAMGALATRLTIGLVVTSVMITIWALQSYSTYRQTLAYLAEPAVRVEPFNSTYIALELPARLDTVFGRPVKRERPAAVISRDDARHLERVLARQSDAATASLASRL